MIIDNKGFKQSVYIIALVYLFIFCIFGLGFVIGYKCHKEYNNTTNNVNNYTKVVDSIKYENHIIKTKINQLDSIKHEEVIKVKSLDNDSTLMLFYELLHE